MFKKNTEFCKSCRLYGMCYNIDGLPPCVVEARKSGGQLAVALMDDIANGYKGTKNIYIPVCVLVALKRWQSKSQEPKEAKNPGQLQKEK